MPEESVVPQPPPPPDAADPEKHPKPRPEGEPEAVVKIRELIEGELSKLVDLYWEEGGNYVLAYQSARVWVVPAWLESGATVIRIFSITNMGVDVDEELTSYLVTKNLDFVVGAFALDRDEGAVWLNHNLLGQFTQPDEIQAAIVMVAETADTFDDEIKAKFGGRLYSEGPEQSIPPPTTPGYL